ncbi:hypothetical protein QYM36_006589, partial [Artemia franciscana]
RICHYTEWPLESLELMTAREVHESFLSFLLKHKKSTRALYESVELEEWLDAWGNLLDGCHSFASLPLWLQTIPRILFLLINRSGSGAITKREFKEFHSRFLGIELTEDLESITKEAYRGMTENKPSLNQFVELQDGDGSEMLDLSDPGDDESDSQYLPLNPELTDFYELTQLEPIKFKSKTDPGHDPLFKVRPIVGLLQENLMRTETEERHCIDEQIIPFKGRSVMWLYLQNKPYKWGLKVFTRAGSSGSMYDIEIYQVRGTVQAGPFGLGGDVVMSS